MNPAFDNDIDNITQIVSARLEAAGIKPMRRDWPAELTAPPSPLPSDSSELARYIDHTLLKPNAIRGEIEQLCAEAREHGFASVCINSSWVELCAERLAGSGVKGCSVAGFPLGAMSGSAKAAEARDAIARGAGEIDMVLNIGRLLTDDFEFVFNDIGSVVEAAGDVPVKVILETGLLNLEQKIATCIIAKAAGAAFVKTSTGFGHGGATEGDIALMRRVVGSGVGVKASGGVRDGETAMRMLKSGANRIGASASVAIVTAGRGDGGY